MNECLNLISKSSLKSFTLLELIIVIVILGILATLGYTQYTKVVEKSRLAEAKVVISTIRKLAVNYHMVNGVTTGIANADVGLGSGSGQIPTACVNTHYFRYELISTDPDWVGIHVYRCTSGGKTPNGQTFDGPYGFREWQLKCSTGQEVWCWGCCWGCSSDGTW